MDASVTRRAFRGAEQWFRQGQVGAYMQNKPDSNGRAASKRERHRHRRRPALPQEQLARLLATSRQTISGIVKTWERQGWVSVSYGQITVLDRDALAALTEEADEA